MNSNNQKVISIIENTISQAVKEYCADDSMHLVSDLYIQADFESGEFQLFDERETLLDKVIIFDWIKSSPNEKAFHQKITPLLKNSLSSLANKNIFEGRCFVKPFSVSLTDDEFNIIEELLFLDNDTFRLDDPLLKNLDAELEEFLSNLLSDIK